MNHLLTALVILIAQAVSVNPLVGLWESDGKSKGGIGAARLPLVSESGRFTHSEGTVALVRDSGPETRMSVKLKDNALTLTDASSKANDWHRVVEGAWYQIKK